MTEAVNTTSGSGAAAADVPKVSALVPSYNAEKFLQRTLDSLAAQTWPNLEILIADDCSKDNTPALIEAFAKDHPNVRILPREKNLGWLRNTNDLMANAAGEFLFFAFHDDAVDPDYAEALATVLISDPDAVMAFSDMEVFDVDGSRNVEILDKLEGNPGPLKRGYIMAGAPFGWWVPNRGLFRKSTFEQIGGIRPNAKGEYSADWTWLLHMSLLGQFRRVPRLLCHKYYQANSLSKQWPHDPGQRLALIHAGMREIWMSPLGFLDKMLLVGYLTGWKFRTHLRPRTRLKQLRDLIS